MNSKLTAYAMDFASFLIQKATNRDQIKNILLFGSVSREEADKTSDIDIFIDITKEDSSLEKEIKKCLDDFLASSKYRNYWQLLETKNEIKLTIGELEKWPELKPSITANGILLYGKFKPEIKEGQHTSFLIWGNIKPNSKRVLLNKQLLGFKQKNKFYEGLLQKYRGEKLGKGCIAVPLEYTNLFLKLFKKYNAHPKIKKVLEYF